MIVCFVCWLKHNCIIIYYHHIHLFWKLEFLRRLDFFPFFGCLPYKTITNFLYALKVSERKLHLFLLTSILLSVRFKQNPPLHVVKLNLHPLSNLWTNETTATWWFLWLQFVLNIRLYLFCNDKSLWVSRQRCSFTLNRLIERST